MKPEIPADYYIFHCWHCDAKISIEVTNMIGMIEDARSKDWDIGKGRAVCPEHNPVLERSEK